MLAGRETVEDRTGKGRELVDMMKKRKVHCVCRRPGGWEARPGAL